MILKLILFVTLVPAWKIVADVIVKIPNGEILGRKEYSLRHISFFSFQQIPFAKPPIGNLRFADPQPAEKWEGILDATKNDRMCYQQSNLYHVNLTQLQNEDCLYLNVYTPKDPSTNSQLPVMFYIYGGGFVSGAANFDFFGPHYLMENDVVVVTTNYRLGPFGFLSTGDETISGNFGLKDLKLALEWVRDNIKYFGGDPTKVTIFGQSAGAASVTYLMMNPKVNGLYRAAIAQSGSTLCPWAYQREYKELAYKLAENIDNNFSNKSSSQELLNFLRTKSADDINNVAASFKQSYGNEQIIQGFWFTPVIEPQYENAFITENQYGAIENGHMNRVPLIIGITSEEAIARAALANFISTVRAYENDISRLVNKNMHITDGVVKKQVGEEIRRIYTDGLLQDNPGKAVNYFSDMEFTKSIITHAKLQSRFSDVYFYQFSYHGTIAGDRPNIDGAYRVGHSEDNHYFWAVANHTYLDRYAPLDVTTSDRLRLLFTNFAKYLNPTPESVQILNNVIWPKVVPEDFHYLDMNETITIQSNPKVQSYDKWVALYEKFAVKPYDSF